jgi:hypothetical protein
MSGKHVRVPKGISEQINARTIGGAACLLGIQAETASLCDGIASIATLPSALHCSLEISGNSIFE